VNTRTIVVMILTLWLVMGLGFLTAYFRDRREGKSKFQCWLSVEGLLFILSVIISILVLVYQSVGR